MKAHVNVITLGVQDTTRAKTFYAEGFGWTPLQDYGEWVTFGGSDGSTVLGLYAWNALAADAGVSGEGGGFRGVTLSHLVSADDQVDAILARAERAGGKIIKPAQDAQWGGRFGFFADPDGYLWKVAKGGG